MPEEQPNEASASPADAEPEPDPEAAPADSFALYDAARQLRAHTLRRLFARLLPGRNRPQKPLTVIHGSTPRVASAARDEEQRRAA